MSQDVRIERLALLVGGGPAPGINGVISAVTIEAVNNNIQVFGILDGFKNLVQGNRELVRGSRSTTSRIMPCAAARCWARRAPIPPSRPRT